MGMKHSPSFSLSTPSLLPYSRRPPVQSKKNDILSHKLLRPVAAMLLKETHPVAVTEKKEERNVTRRENEEEILISFHR
jgi:hypothetical protein